MGAFQNVFGSDCSPGEPIQVITGRSQTIHLEIAQTGSVQIPAYRVDGTPIDWASKTLRFTVADNRNALVHEIANPDITRAIGSFTIYLGGDLTAKRRTLRWRMLEITGGNEIEILQGLFPVY